MEAVRSGRVIWIAVGVAFLYVVWFNFNKFVVTKNYDFFVEAPCDSATESCYLRDCEDYCPPNGLASYKVWKLLARDFARCSDDSCEKECVSGRVNCELVPCDPEEADCS